MRLTLPEMKKKIASLVPDGIEYEVELEAGSIAIITKQPRDFAGIVSPSESPRQLNAE
jgi:hypothetical protein